MGMRRPGGPLLGGNDEDDSKDRHNWVNAIADILNGVEFAIAARILAITGLVSLALFLGSFALTVNGRQRAFGPQDDLKEQLERAYWENVGFDMDALSEVPPGTFANSMFIGNSMGQREKFIWDYFLPHYSCAQKERVGTLAKHGDNGKWICGMRSLLQRPGCVVYSLGSAGDTSFEAGLLKHTKCEIHVFDPTLNPEQKALVLALPGVHLHEYGLGTTDGNFISNGQNTFPTSRPVQLDSPLKSLQTIMRELGHTWIDVLKVDIEGAEWQVLDDLTRQPGRLPFTQLQVEYHNWPGSAVKPDFMLKVLARLVSKDMRVFHVEPNLWSTNNGFDFVEYAYIQVDKNGNLVVGNNGG